MRTKPITIKLVGNDQYDISDEHFHRDYHLRKENGCWYLDIFDSTKPTDSAHVETKVFEESDMDDAIEYVTNYPLSDAL